MRFLFWIGKSEKAPALLLRTFLNYFLNTDAQKYFELPVKVNSNRVQKQQLKMVYKESRIECLLLFDNDISVSNATKIIDDFIALKPICTFLVLFLSILHFYFFLFFNWRFLWLVQVDNWLRTSEPGRMSWIILLCNMVILLFSLTHTLYQFLWFFSCKYNTICQPRLMYRYLLQVVKSARAPNRYSKSRKILVEFCWSFSIFMAFAMRSTITWLVHASVVGKSSGWQHDRNTLHPNKNGLFLEMMTIHELFL